jgi:Co/Zn/Cd efflux system component
MDGRRLVTGNGGEEQNPAYRPTHPPERFHEVRSDDVPGDESDHPPRLAAHPLRRAVVIVALLNFAYFFVEFAVALAAGSVSLLADSVDFLEDTSINLLIFVALGWPLARRALMGKVMALVILGPAAVAGWKAVQHFPDPSAPQVVPVVLASLGAIVVNGTSAWLLAQVRHRGGSLSRAAFLSARNDVLVNVAIIGMAVVTALSGSGWPDLVLGCFIIALALHAAWEVWEVSEEERLAAKALAGEAID